MSLGPRTRLGAYEIRSLLGAGGMGEVYRARDERLGRDVAIKVLSAEVTSDVDRLKRFANEARAASSLNHPNIVTIHEVQQSGVTFFIVMELVEGKTLREILAGGPVPVRRLLAIGAQIADGLAVAHASGIVHRDLKPENVMVTKDGLVKILDFGLAKLTQPEVDGGQPTESATVTKPGLVMGTVGYMSPEQASGHPVDFHSDQFSLGTILYEMATGKQAFKRPTDAQTLAAIIQEEPESIVAQNPKVSAPVRWIVERSLAKEPRLRYASTEDLARELATIRDRLPELTSGEAIPPAVKRSTLAFRKRLFIWGGVALAAVAALILFQSAQRTPTPRRHVSLVVPGIDWPGTAVSPDGERLVYVGLDSKEKPLLYLRELSEDKTRSLPETENAFLPFWSPDSRAVGFFVLQPGGGLKLKRIGITDTSSLVLCDAFFASGGTWGADEVIIFGTRNGPLYRVSAAGGRASAVTRLDSARGEIAHRNPYFLPDGRRFLFLVQSKGDRFMALEAASINAPDRTRLGKVESNVAYAPPGYLLSVTADRTLVAEPFDVERLRITGNRIPIAEKLIVWGRWSPFSVSRNGIVAYRDWLETDNKTFAWLDRSGRQLESFGSPKDYRFFALSPDGTRLAAAALDPRTAETQNLWMYEFARKTTTRFTFGSPSWIDTHPSWSPDGSRIAFSSNRNGIYDLYVKSAGGDTSETPLRESESDKWVDGWSPDGRFLLYENSAEGRNSLWALPMTGDRKPLPVTQTPFREEKGRFSPDGRLIAYLSNESGRSEVYVRTFPQPTAIWQVSSGGGEKPLWRRDGKELFYLSSDELMSVAVETRREFTASTPRALFRLSRQIGREDYDAAPDGQRFLFLLDEKEETEVSTIKLIFNWLPESRR